ncbi:MAG: type II toxin-antitoxin system HicA family toxin [Terracidiphilus sp.]
MSIDYSRLRSVTARQFVSALHDDGFQLQRQRGSHRHYRHPDGRRVTLSFHHSGDTFPLGTLKSMVEMQAHWTETDLRRLGLID